MIMHVTVYVILHVPHLCVGGEPLNRSCASSQNSREHIKQLMFTMGHVTLISWGFRGLRLPVESKLGGGWVSNWVKEVSVGSGGRAGVGRGVGQVPSGKGSLSHGSWSLS